MKIIKHLCHLSHLGFRDAAHQDSYSTLSTWQECGLLSCIISTDSCVTSICKFILATDLLRLCFVCQLFHTSLAFFYLEYSFVLQRWPLNWKYSETTKLQSVYNYNIHVYMFVCIVSVYVLFPTFSLRFLNW